MTDSNGTIWQQGDRRLRLSTANADYLIAEDGTCQKAFHWASDEQFEAAVLSAMQWLRTYDNRALVARARAVIAEAGR